MLPFNMGAGGSSGVDTGDIGHSLRFRGAQYLSKTLAAATDSTKGTIDIRFKPNVVASAQVLFSAYDDVNNYMYVLLYSDYTMLIVWVISGTQYFAKTNRVFRSPDWITATITFDTNNATQSSRAIIKINGGAAETYSSNDLPQTTGLRFNSAHPHYIGSLGASTYFGGYMARFVFVGDQLKNPTDFGYFNTTINEWVTKSQSAVKAVVDSGGTNSFMLDFDDGTSLTTLGNDKSSKGNNWTLNNFSLTAGATYDWMLDVPGNNFPVVNQLNKASTTTIDNANLRIQSTGLGAGWRSSFPIPAATGKWFYEVTIEALGTGVTLNHVAIGDQFYALDLTSGSFYYYRSDGTIQGSSGYATFSAGSVIGVALTTSGGSGTVDFYHNGVFQKTISVGTSTDWWPGGLLANASAPITHVNFGQRPFAYTPPTGFKSLCQANLPTPAILNPEQHFDVKLDLGANIKSTMDALFSGNVFEWIKDRANANNHQLADVNRGLAAILQSNTTAAETTYSAPAGNSVGWGWKAGGSPVTNNAGSISSQVSANVLAGQSVVTCTMQASGTATIGHGLGKRPALIIGKRRGNTSSWVVYHWALGASQYIVLNSTAGLVGDTTVWNNVEPTTSVFSEGTSFAGLGDYVFYCFAEVPGFSKIGSYTGNGSADGPYVECGFKPKFVMVKRTDVSAPWSVLDAVREPSNRLRLELQPNSAYVENDITDPDPGQFDFTATGFKVRTAPGDTNSAYTNANGGTYIFYAIADVPGKYSLAR